MRAVLKLEFIGENYFAHKRSGKPSTDAMQRYQDILGPDKSRPWVARITGTDEKHGFARQFVDGQIDYSQANSCGSRGVYLYYPLREGIYEVNARERWNKVRRYFIRVTGDTYKEIDRMEVEQWLNSLSA